MKADITTKLILVIHGPSMNLISHTQSTAIKNLTLDKINKLLKKEARLVGCRVKIIQKNNEGDAAKNIQKYRNKIDAIIIFPGPWQKSGHTINDTLKILQIPFVTVSMGERVENLKGQGNIKEIDTLKGCQKAIEKLIKLI